MQLQWKQSHDFYRKRSCQGQENVSKHPLQHLCLFLNAYMFSLGNEGANENTSDRGNSEGIQISSRQLPTAPNTDANTN